jgi:hypothetical protein
MWRIEERGVNIALCGFARIIANDFKRSSAMRCLILSLLVLSSAVLIAEDNSGTIKPDHVTKVSSKAVNWREINKEIDTERDSYKLDESQTSEPGNSKAVRHFHAKNVFNFVEMQDFGLSRTFSMHDAFSLSLKTPSGKGETYTLKSRELIGLIVNPKPVVYEAPSVNTTSGALQMKMPANTTTRELDAFEKAALRKLRDGLDITTSEESDALRIVGSIRAKKDCLSCHECKEGALLGAFSYRLVHITPELAKEQIYKENAGAAKLIERMKCNVYGGLKTPGPFEKEKDSRFIRMLESHASTEVLEFLSK